MQCGSMQCFSMQFSVIYCLPLSYYAKYAIRWWDIYFDRLPSWTIKKSSSIFFYIRRVGSQCFTSLISDRQPLFRMSCPMRRFWLWWSAVCVTIWTTEALTMHFKPSKWAQAEVRYLVVAILVTARALCWVFCPTGQVLLWLCCMGLQPLWSTITSTMQSWSYRVRSDPFSLSTLLFHKISIGNAFVLNSPVLITRLPKSW